MLCRCEVCNGSFNNSWDKTICTVCEEKKRKFYNDENQKVLLEELGTLLNKITSECKHDDNLHDKLVGANIYPSQLKEIVANLRRVL